MLRSFSTRSSASMSLALFLDDLVKAVQLPAEILLLRSRSSAHSFTNELLVEVLDETPVAATRSSRKRTKIFPSERRGGGAR